MAGLKGAQVAGKISFQDVSRGCFQKRLAFELVDSVNQMALPSGDKHHPIHLSPRLGKKKKKKKKKKEEEEEERERNTHTHTHTHTHTPLVGSDSLGKIDKDTCLQTNSSLIKDQLKGFCDIV